MSKFVGPFSIASLVCFLAPAPSVGQTLGDAHLATGSELLSFCARSSRRTQTACLGYIAGVSDSMISRQIANPKTRRQVCIPRTVKAGDRAAKVITWMGRHTNELNKPAAGLVMRALSEAYPCKTKKP